LYTPIFYVIRNLLMEYPLTRNWLVEAKQPGHLMIIGCTGLSEELILQASLTSHFPNVSRLLIYILGKDADAWWEGVLSRHSGLADICEFTVISADPEISSFSPIKAVQDATKRASLTGIYLCLTDSAVNWKLALALYGIGQEVSSNSLFIPTYVYSANMSSIAESLHSGSFVLPGLSMLVPFGDGHVEQSVDIFLDNKGEQLAIAVHEGYLSDLASGNLPITGREAAKGWDLLNERSKASCRQVADHFAIKLRSIRCRAVPAGKSLKPPFFFTADEIERLAEAEHRRWMSERLISGWRYGPQRDNALKIHPDLVPYDRLSDGSRKQDRGMIRRIPEQYAAAGFAIVRDHIIGLILSPEIDDESARLFATQLLGNIIRRCHQHTVVVCSLRQEAECRIIGTVLEEGNISLWVVTPTLSVLGSEQSALNLLARAERCLDLSVAGLWHETTTDLSAIYLGMCDEVMQ
ncbi:MAG: RyR domain-containing protein, partial [Rhodospirillaceae bacterium]